MSLLRPDILGNGLSQLADQPQGVRPIQLGMQYEPEPPLGPIDWDPAITEAVRPIWRPPLEDILAAHPHLARRVSPLESKRETFDHPGHRHPCWRSTTPPHHPPGRAGHGVLQACGHERTVRQVEPVLRRANAITRPRQAVGSRGCDTWLRGRIEACGYGWS
jgi:hypothetical protein